MRTRIGLVLGFLLLIGVGLLETGAFSQMPTGEMLARWKLWSQRMEQQGLTPFRGVTADGKVEPGLFRIESSGVSAEPLRKAAEEFLAALSPEQRKKTVFPVDDSEWRKWANQHLYVRQGVPFYEMDEAQKDSAFALFRASLSEEGFQLTRDIMNLNRTLGELSDDDFLQYNEQLYWITVMGEPSSDKPWGWQLDGHHVILNFFVLGDQVVATPLFVGSEPVIAESGRFKGTAILQDEQGKGLELVNSLDDSQQAKAIIEASKTGNDNVGEAFQDNAELAYAGLPVSEMKPEQKRRLLELVSRYVGNMRAQHAEVRMEEVKRHLDRTYFAWIGGTKPDAVFYYRIHSPVILIEFDHQRPVGMRHLVQDRRVPIRQHIHAVVRTPNGNDYGKDLLRQHYAQSRH
jgi:uncharacterized protein DUF3500